MLRVDVTHIRKFLTLPYEAALAPRLKLAHDRLQRGDGAGGEVTGWVWCRTWR